MSEFDRLFVEFKSRDPEVAELWLGNVQSLGVLEEVQHLALAYQRQNEEIHKECTEEHQCNILCEHKQREINWIARGGPWCFNFAECDISEPVSDVVWKCFAILLSCSEHASVREWLSAKPGYHLALDQLWDPAGTEWQERLAERFAPVRQPTAKDGHRPIEGYAACP
jgi:hypothetical protein